jgi:hypothetical protein
MKSYLFSKLRQIVEMGENNFFLISKWGSTRLFVSLMTERIRLKNEGE